MFSYLLSGRLGDFMAPRPSSAQEIWSLLKAGMFDKVLTEIRKPTFAMDVNGLDISSGMTILHFACAGGSVELVAELLSRGTDLTVPSADGNNALHFAAINNRKGIIEVLLRSGADPSVPNHAGMLPIELTKVRDVKELFLRDRTGIFSPIAIAQTRAMLSEYVKAQTPSKPSGGDVSSAEGTTGMAPNSAVSSLDTAGSSKTSMSLPVFNMTNEFEKEVGHSPASNSSYLTSSPPAKVRGGSGMSAAVAPTSPSDGESAPFDILSPLNSKSKHPPSRLHQEHSDSASMSDDGDYTIVGVASVKKPNGFRPSLFREVSASSTAESALDGIESPIVATPTASPEKARNGGVTMVPMLNLAQLAPPPIDPLPDVVSYSVSGIPSARGARPPIGGSAGVSTASGGPPPPSGTGVTPLVLSARRGSGGSDREPTPGSPTSKSSSSINFYQPDTGIPVNTLILSPSHPSFTGGFDADESESHTLFTDYNSNNNRSASHRRHQQALTNSQLKSGSGSGRGLGTVGTTLFTEAADPDADELQKAVVLAATETAMSFQSNRDEYEARRVVIRNCQKLNEKTLRKLLTYDPSLAVSRATELGALAPDGQTPLHVAASFGNIEALQILLEMGASAGASCWVRDIQGRTPLHVAAEKGKKECCEFLRAQMKQERRDPVGQDAPTDLAGTTPLGWASISSKGKPKTGVESLLFKPGDRSILPLTPHSIRAGKSPWKSGHHGTTSGLHHHEQQRENLVFAFSEANGWTPIMEDRVMICCPVVNHPSWSLFGVFDGHGGSFCSSFLAAGIPAILSREATIIGSQYGCHDHDITPQIVSQLLTNICTSADEELSKHPRMAVEKSETGKITCLDSSGSTGVMALLTSKFVSVSNVGDSRAVLAVRQPTPSSPAPSELTAKTLGVSTPGDKLHDLDQIVSTPDNPEGRGPLDNLAASIERLNPNLSTPTTATPHASHYGSRQSPSMTGICPAPYLPGFLQAVELSRDHKPFLPDEKSRAEAAGAIVDQVPNSTAYQMTVKGADVKLRMSRSFGDFYMKQNSHLPPEKQAVIAVPEVMTHTRGSSDAFLVLACDGIFDVMTNQEVVDFFGEKLGFTGSHSPVVSTQLAAEACDALLSECLTRGTVDNISVILIVLGSATSSLTHPAPHSANPYQYYNASMGSSSAVASSAQRRNSHNAHGSEMRSSHSSDTLHHHIQRSPRDYSVDMPISGSLAHHQKGSAMPSTTPLHVFQPTSLNNVFSNVASGVAAKPIHTVSSHGSLDSDSSDTIGSPLNTVAGSVANLGHSGRVRKQLQFNDDP